jgi:3-phytase
MKAGMGPPRKVRHGPDHGRSSVAKRCTGRDRGEVRTQAAGALRGTLSTAVLCAWSLAFPAPGSTHAAEPREVIQPVRVTERVPLDPDDPAIWIDPENPERSLVLGTYKGTGSADRGPRDGALYAFDLSGAIVKEKTIRGLSRPNNVDVEYGLEMQGGPVDIAVVTERRANRIRVYRLPDMVAIDGGGIAVFEGEPHREPMGIALYRRPRDGSVFAIVSRKRGPVKGGYLWQYRLEDAGGGQVRGVKVRQFGEWSGTKEIEALVVDDALGYVYGSDERVGVRKYHADPDRPDANEELALFATEGFKEDREGLSIYEVTDTTGYIIVSDQSANTFHVFTREGEPGEPHHHEQLKTIRLATLDSDGSDVTNRWLGDAYPGGLFVAMSDEGRFHYYSWSAIAGDDLAVSEPVRRSPLSP